MIELKGVAHFSIPVSDVDKSTKFYTEVVACKFLSQLPNQKITFLDAGGVCVLLIKRPAPIHKGEAEMSDGVHHAFMVDAGSYQAAMDSLRSKGVDIFFEEAAGRHDRRPAFLLSGPRRNTAGDYQPHALFRKNGVNVSVRALHAPCGSA